MRDDIEFNMGDLRVVDGGPEDPEPFPAEDRLAVATRPLLISICLTAESHYGLRVGECDAPGAPDRWGPVHQVHARGSLHYAHRAADVSGLEKNMGQFCHWIARNFVARCAELIHNPGCSIKNGHVVNADFWGAATWNAHRNHVHVAI